MRSRTGSIHLGAEDEKEERIQVFTRVRPLCKQELLAWRALKEGEDSNSVSSSPSAPPRPIRRRHSSGNLANEEKHAFALPNGEVRVGDIAYKFDGSFDEATDQAAVFESCGLPQVEAVCEGFNAALIAYGQTGSGKTFSMLGEDLWQLAAKSKGTDSEPLPTKSALLQSKSRGILPRSLERIFHYIEKEAPGKQVYAKCLCSYMEIYNEKVYDLLSSSNSKRVLGERGLDILEDEYNGVHVPDMVKVPVYNLDQVYDLLWRGALNRAVDATDMNEYSSRSHTIFQVILEQHSLAEGSDQRFTSKLNLVDLAGSEKWRTHQLSTFTNQRIQEMTSINQSLSNLGNCIRALLGPKQSHVPYRNSKLTRILQDSLGGNSKTSFLVTLSPSGFCAEETMSSLQFADRAKRVVMRVSIREDLNDAALIKKLQGRIRSLEVQLEKANKTAADNSSSSGGNEWQSDERQDENHARGNRPMRLKRCQQKDEVQRKEEQGEEMGELAIKVMRASKKLEQWVRRTPGAKYSLDEEKTLESYEKWLFQHLIDQPEAINKVLTADDRLVMAEWAVLIQAQRLQKLASKNQ